MYVTIILFLVRPTTTIQDNNRKNVRTVPQEGNKKKAEIGSNRDHRLDGTQGMEGMRQNLSVFLPSPSPSSSQKIKIAHGQLDELDRRKEEEKEGEGGYTEDTVLVPVSLTVRSPSHSVTQMQSPSQRRTLLLRRAAENASRLKDSMSNQKSVKQLPRAFSLNSLENIPNSKSDIMPAYSDIYNSNQEINYAEDEGEWLLDRNRNRLHLQQYHLETEYDVNDDENEEDNEGEGQGDSDGDSLNCPDPLGNPTRHSRLRPRSAKGRIRSPGSGSGSGSRTVTPPFVSPTNVTKIENDEGLDVWGRKSFQKSDSDKNGSIQSESIKNRENKNENQDDDRDGENAEIEVEGSVTEEDYDDVGTGCTNEAFIGTLSALNRSPSRGPILTDGPISSMTSPSYSLYSKKSFQPSLRAGLQEQEYKIEDINKYIQLLQSQLLSQTQSQSQLQPKSKQFFQSPRHLSAEGGLSQSLKEAIRESVEDSLSKLLGTSFQDMINKKGKGKKIMKKRKQKDSPSMTSEILLLKQIKS